MRDKFGRIAPDFEAWEKLGYHLISDIHSTLFTLVDSEDYYCYNKVVAEYDPDCTENGLPEYTKEEKIFSNVKSIPFTPDELEQIKKDTDNFKKEVKNNDR